MPEAASKDPPDSLPLPSQPATRGKQVQDESLTMTGTSSQPEDGETQFWRLIRNPALIVLCVYAVAVFLAVHGAPWHGFISAVLGSVVVSALPKFLPWALKPYAEEIEKKVRRILGSTRLTRWLQGLLAVLVLFNLLFLPQEAKAKIGDVIIGKRVILRIVPVGNLYTVLAGATDEGDVRFDLRVHRAGRSYDLERIGPGIVYTGAASENLRREHKDRSAEIEPLVIEILGGSEVSEENRKHAISNWKQVQYLATSDFRENNKLIVEVRCVNPAEAKDGTFATKEVLLVETPIQTEYLDATFENNPCTPPG